MVINSDRSWEPPFFSNRLGCWRQKNISPAIGQRYLGWYCGHFDKRPRWWRWIGVRGLPFTTFAKTRIERTKILMLWGRHEYKTPNHSSIPFVWSTFKLGSGVALRWPKLTRYTTAASILLSRHFLPPFTSLPPFAFQTAEVQPTHAQAQRALCERCQQTTTLSPPSPWPLSPSSFTFETCNNFN